MRPGLESLAAALLLAAPLLTGCEATEPSGHPFSPAPASMGEPPPPPSKVPEAPAASGDEEEIPGTFVLHSGPEEPLEAEPEPAAEEPEPAAEEGDEPAPRLEELASSVARAEAEEQEPEQAPTTSTPGSNAPTPSLEGWPVVLVATVPDAQPPRAILDLPSGEERVVTPGSMIPEARLVVLAVGDGLVELAELRPQGDRAVVVPRTLHALH